MATIRAAPPPSISAIGQRRPASRPRRWLRPARAEPRLRAPQQRMAAMTRQPAAGSARRSVARMKAAPATASPAPTARDRSLENVTCSYCGPVAERIATDTGQHDDASVISPKTLPDSELRCPRSEIRPRTHGCRNTLCHRKKGRAGQAASVRSDSNLQFETVLKCGAQRFTRAFTTELQSCRGA